MEQPDPDSSRGGSWPLGDDALRNLEARLDRASEAAERLVAEAAARVSARAAGAPPESSAGASPVDARREASPSDPPAAGWQVPDGADGPAGSGRDLALLLGLLGSLRDLIPPELQQRLAEAVRELLLALRALIDWYLERSERRRSQPSEVQDIPIQ